MWKDKGYNQEEGTKQQRESRIYYEICGHYSVWVIEVQSGKQGGGGKSS